LDWYDKVLGQKAIMAGLHDSIATDTLSHALIIEGPSGYGGLPIALSMAEHILCLANNDGKACGVCKSCNQVSGLVHPDLHLAYPVVKKEGTERKNTTSKDYMPIWREVVIDHPYVTYNEWIRNIAKTSANGDINAKECNDIIQQLNFKAFSGSKKVQIIWIADRLGNNGNKLLKLIEEPPDGTYLILICNDLSAILQTIISRCRIIRLASIDAKAVSQGLIERAGISDEEAEQIAYICDGDFSVALDYARLDQNNLMEQTLEWMSICEQFDLIAMRRWATDFSRQNIEEQKAVLHFMLKTLQALIYYQLLGEEAIKLSKGDRSLLRGHTTLLSLDTDAIEELNLLVSSMITRVERYVNSRMVMFDASLKISRIITTSIKKNRSSTSVITS